MDYDTEIDTVTETRIRPQTTVHIDKFDWGYNFWEGAGGKRPNNQEEFVRTQMRRLKFIEENLERDDLKASNYGGTPRIWHKVIGIGMVSKWPYWEPRPSVRVKTTMGTKWLDWSTLTNVKTDEKTV